MKKVMSLLLGVSLLALTSVSFAGIITDTIDQKVKLGWLQSYSYTHDINDDGFDLGSAISGTLSVEIFDDNDFFPEALVLTVEKFDFDTGGFSFGSAFFGDLEIKALTAINADGLLDVKVTSLLGDFYVGQSVLTVVTRDVPAPSALLLMGLGLMGLGASRLRKTQA